MKKQSLAQAVLLILFTWLISLPSIASAKNDSIELMTGLPKPPFIIGETGEGMQLDIVRAAFGLLDIDVKYLHVPLARTIAGYKRWNADGVITVPKVNKLNNLFVSVPYISYQNVAVSLQDNSVDLTNVSNLSFFDVVAFQNARKFLGDEFAQATSGSDDKFYQEVADQSRQIRMLFAREAEVIILDINIFKYFLHENGHEKLFSKPFDIHYIFNERNYSAGFKNKKHRDAFDKGIREIKANGQYQAILDKYLLLN